MSDGQVAAVTFGVWITETLGRITKRLRAEGWHFSRAVALVVISGSLARVPVRSVNEGKQFGLDCMNTGAKFFVF